MLRKHCFYLLNGRQVLLLKDLVSHSSCSSPSDIDVVVVLRGPIAPRELCNGLMVPIVAFEQIYSFNRLGERLDCPLHLHLKGDPDAASLRPCFSHRLSFTYVMNRSVIAWSSFSLVPVNSITWFMAGYTQN
jgi:hypothetical protein